MNLFLQIVILGDERKWKYLEKELLNFWSAEIWIMNLAHFHKPFSMFSIGWTEGLKVITAEQVEVVLKQDQFYFSKFINCTKLKHLWRRKYSFHCTTIFGFAISEMLIVSLIGGETTPTLITFWGTAGFIAGFINTSFRLNRQTFFVANHLLFKVVA